MNILTGMAIISALSPAVAPLQPVARLLSSIKVGSSLRHENLTVFPLTGSGSAGTEYGLLDEAIAAGSVRVQEKDGGQVNTVRMRNDGKHYVFGMAGEIVSGAKQDRMLQDDVLLPPNSGWLDVPVFCTEHGRWQGSSHEFGTKGQVVAGRVRERAAKTQSQSEVWAEVDAARSDLKVESPTQAFAKVYDAPDVQDKVGEYERRLSDLPAITPGANGVLVAVGSRVVCVDVFGSSSLFRKMWPKLLRSYVIDAVSQQPRGRLDRDDVRQFIQSAARASTVARPTVGAGVLYRLNAASAAGSALVHGTGVVHIDLFPDGNGEIRDAGDAPRLQLRRDRSQR